ncbi:ABC transporter permease [Pseudoalteromonas piscicida]|uniref:ABC transporter permease n=1 Tax=Pseudoalteromonas piscicida TaxID=43662 RepID=UPI001EFDA747|nr:ABC transporter permease [Pseudoalteromonas piscicida]MCG9767035.1 ABC transporter permease [Pseudoalteromonas piscicida]
MLVKDMSASLYSLSKVKVFTITIISTLALTLGTLVAMFNLNFTILSASLPYPNAEQLYVSKAVHYIKDRVEFDDFTPIPMLLEIYENEKTPESQTALFGYSEEVIRSKVETPQVNTTYITPEFMPMLGFTFHLGRGPSADEGLNSMQPVAVLSYQAWQKYYGQAADIVGQSIQIDQVNFKIIGVLSEQNREPEMLTPGRLTDVWLPWDYYSFQRRDAQHWGITGPNRHVLIKKAGTVDIPTINHQLSTHYNSRFKTQTASSSFFDDMTITLELLPLREKIHGDSASKTIWLLLGALCLLLIACANIANLILARAVNQQRDMAIKAALGAGRGHLSRGIFIELLILTSSAAMLSFAVSELCYYLLRLVAADNLPGVLNLSTNFITVALCLILAVLLASLGAWLVSKRINFKQLNSQLQSSGKGTGIQIKTETRKALIFSQLFLASLLLLACSQTFINAWGLLNQSPNFSTSERYEVELNQLVEQRPAREQRDAFYAERRQQLLDVTAALKQNPQFKAVSLTTGTPIEFGLSTFLATDSGFQTQYSVSGNIVDESYLPLMEISLLQGRNFTTEEVNSQSAVLIVNQAFAEQLGPQGDAIGKRFYWLNGRRHIQYEIIGISENLAIPDKPDTARMWAVDRLSAYTPAFIIQTHTGQQILPQSINQTMAQISKRWRVAEIQPLSQQLSNSLAIHQVAGWAALSLATITLLIALIGIYGVLNYGVSMRRYELGVRMAIGASPKGIVLGLLGENTKVIFTALGCATFATVAAMAWLANSEVMFSVSLLGFVLPLSLIIGITAATTVLAASGVITKPALYSLRSN